jgi:hypothetical protein
MTTDEFDGEVKAWLATARHPQTNIPYDEMIYQPMLELLAYLRANEFKTFIVSGGGVEFMRLCREGVWNSARAGGRVAGKARIRGARWKTGPREAARGPVHR